MRGSLRRRKFETEFGEEIEEHLSLLAERYMRQDMSAEQARWAAWRQFGGVTQLDEELRDRNRFRPWEAVMQDIVCIFR